MAIRVTRTLGEIAYSDRSNLRVTRVQGTVAFNDRTNPLRITRAQAQVVYNDRTNPIRVTRMVAQVLRTLADAPEPPRVEVLRLKEREINPYRATAPLGLERNDRDTYDFLREQGEHLRAQHNLTQAGDSTFPWEQLTKFGKRKLYTLGSLGRFFHDEFGLIMARYVQFESMSARITNNGPVGRLASSDSVDWIVTNDRALSSADLPLGLMGAIDSVESGNYGWVIVNGANINYLSYDGAVIPAAGDELVWSDYETVGLNGVGRVIGRVWSTLPSTLIPPGAVFVNSEPMSVASLRAALDSDFASIVTGIDDVKKRVDALEAVVDPATLADIRESIAANERAILAEAEKRAIDVKKLAEQIRDSSGGAVTPTDLENLAASVSESLAALAEQLGLRIDAAMKVAREALARPIPDIGPILTRLDAIEAAIQDRPVSLIPLVVGIPPQLVYFDDGSLTLVEGG